MATLEQITAQLQQLTVDFQTAQARVAGLESELQAGRAQNQALVEQATVTTATLRTLQDQARGGGRYSSDGTDEGCGVRRCWCGYTYPRQTGHL